MASYSIFPKPAPPNEQAVCSPGSRGPPQSRFVEGSMNDRISNVPPPDFLGPEDLAAYERQFYLSNASSSSSSSSSRRPGSSSDKKSSGGFFGPLLEKLHLTRARSASSMASNKSKRPASQQDQREQGQQQQQTIPNPPGIPIAYPTREEVMENYKSLMDSGFFSSHAIQGSRHPRTSSGQLPSVTESPARPAPASKSFSQHLASKQQPPQTSSSPLEFSSIPYSSTKPSPTGDPPLTLYPRPTTSSSRPPLSSHGRPTRPPPPPPTSTTSPDESPQRGTKRAVADIAGGVVDREWAETGARKLVKKLRKSASRISVDMAVRRSIETSSSSSRPPTRNCSSAGGPLSGGSATAPPPSALSRPATSSVMGKEVPRHSVTTMRSFSSSWKPGSDIESDKRKSGKSPNRLSKAKKALGGGGSRRRRRSTSRSPGPVSHHHRQSPAPPQRAPPPVPVTRRRNVTPSPSPAPESMLVDSPPPMRPSFDGVVNGLSVPSFHYPQRMRSRNTTPVGGIGGAAAAPEPLSVVPDANRGIPSVPRIPMHFKHRRQAGGGSADIRDSGIGDENCESLVKREDDGVAMLDV